ncbi:hypothetical protein PV327_002963 [Microctonus hyperodae]|uniref:Uncharacterized protein n=1 Tax=Microctonus hyperodae TaxID=165561 RepID=A0AA39L0N0_MICHY|nr:hypothetical protein PV327_002963 [Microctonus hyperodae]
MGDKIERCVFCTDLSGKKIMFSEEKLKKCVDILNCRIKFNLKYAQVQLPPSVNTTDGYHRQCYSAFTSLMAKYRNVCVSTSASITDVPSTSSDTSSILHSPMNVSETALDDAASTVEVERPMINKTNVSTDDINFSSESINETPVFETSAIEKSVCFYCEKNRKQVKRKQQTLHSSKDEKIYKKIENWMIELNNVELLKKINDLKSAGESVYYHHSCELLYFSNYNKIIANNPRTSWHVNRDVHKQIFKYIVLLIDTEVIQKKNYLLLSSLCDLYNTNLENELKETFSLDSNSITNHALESKIVKHFQRKIKIVIKHKHKIIMHTDCNLIEDNDLINGLEENDLIDKAALILRKLILNIEPFKLSDTIKTQDLMKGECSIPDKLDRFYKVLMGGKDIRQRDDINCERLTNSLASDAIFCVRNGTVMPRKQIALGMSIKSLSNSRKIVNILNRFGHCCNYNALEELETETTISSVASTQIFPLDIVRDPLLCSGVTFDDFDESVDIINDNTIGMIYQNIDEDVDDDQNIVDNESNEMLPGSCKRRRL